MGNMYYKELAYKSINVEYHFSPFYSIFILDYFFNIFSNNKSVNPLANDIYNKFKENNDMVYDQFTEIMNNIHSYSDKNETLYNTLDTNIRITDYVKTVAASVKKSQSNEAFLYYYYLLFEDKYKYFKSSHTQPTLYIIPTLINSNIKDINDYFDYFDKEFKRDRPIRNVTSFKERIKLVFKEKPENIDFFF